MARQPWKLTRLMWPLLIAALLPMTLASAAGAVDSIAERLCANDGRRADRKQVDRYRSRFVPETWPGAIRGC
jgi:hypothetical protein